MNEIRIESGAVKETIFLDKYFPKTTSTNEDNRGKIKTQIIL